MYFKVVVLVIKEILGAFRKLYLFLFGCIGLKGGSWGLLGSCTFFSWLYWSLRRFLGSFRRLYLFLGGCIGL